MAKDEKALMIRRNLPPPEIIRKYGIRELVREKIIEDYQSDRLVRRTTERERIKFQEY
jgi:hypothetical protein